VRDDPTVRAVVIISGKPDNFIAGADIEEFTAITTQAQAERLSFEGQETVSRVETSQKPIVAAIHGACLGGGLELALAPAIIALPLIIPRLSSGSPRCSSGSSRAQAVVSGSPA
jgi:enoyl-CoA hydratase/carnithine racemase